MTSPEEIERHFTLRTALNRFEELRLQESLYDGSAPTAGGAALDIAAALELLALGEVIVRKVGYGRQLTVRAAREAGASWTQVGAAMGSTKQAAWEAHARWLDRQTDQDRSEA